MPEVTLKRIVVFGGGRWARSLIQVLRGVLPEDAEILWVSRHSYEAAESWLGQHPVSNLQLVRNVSLATAGADAVIVATTPESHYAIVQQTQAQGLPTLCEKPIASDLAGAKKLLELSQVSGCPLGIHLEFLYANYLRDFAELVGNSTVRCIHIDWQDPWSEERNSELKYGEFYTDIMNDQLPHCWSVLSVMRPGETGLTVSEIRGIEAGADVIGQFGTTAITCRLGRRADRRIRQVSVNHGEWILNFSQEPGVIVHEGEVVNNSWTADRPLIRSLSSFISVAVNPAQQHNWPLSLTNCFDAVQSSLAASATWQTFLESRIQELQRSADFDLENPEHVRLVVDRFLPEFAAFGQRILVRTLEEQTEFVRIWMSRSG